VLALVLVAVEKSALADAKVGADVTEVKIQLQGSANSAGVCLGVCFQLDSA
jgi:hypothetical protein